MTVSKGLKIHISGIVQGVGFRPFVYGLATRLGLTGWVRNTAAGVDIEVDGSAVSLENFTQALQTEKPPLARIDIFQVTPQKYQGFKIFQIIHSDANQEDFIPVSPDVCICPDCLQELLDPTDRRYHYPFINCTNCGPRFTIIKGIPYDRPNTTMAGFTLCTECSQDYNDPTNRRFHAQPVACSVCGPTIWLEYAHKDINLTYTDLNTSTVLPKMDTDKVIQEVQQLLFKGKIVAIKGLGGFHLACDATNPAVVSELRNRKLRVDKPFAVMMPDIATVERHCYLNDSERELLQSRQRPIVVLKRKPGSTIALEITPEQHTLGVMLPYTPLHYLLFVNFDAPHPILNPSAFVMTSGNLSEEPIATDNEEALERLSGLCDVFLLHNRPIRTRCDDSVVRVIPDLTNKTHPGSVNNRYSSLVLRRSRGYAPDSIRLPFDVPPLLAAGPELKNTFCLARGDYAFISHHIGDMQNYETYQAYEDGINHFERLFRIKPTAIAYDLHPNYLSTHYALNRAQREGLPAFAVQHHHAHIAACMADNGLPGDQPVIGVAFDGTGYGTDGTIWGGEILITDYSNYQRAAHLAVIPLPGGDTAIRHPWRIALAWLYQCGIEWSGDLAPVKAAKLDQTTGFDTLQALRHQLDHRINTPLTSSMGRLFDAIAALSGVRQSVNYEAQAAIEFEALVDPYEKGVYPFEIYEKTGSDNQDSSTSTKTLVIDPKVLIVNLISDIRAQISLPIISARFHNTLAEMINEVAFKLRIATGISQIVLNGGVWQNTTLLTKTVVLLQKRKFKTIIPRQIPPNDGGISLGQILIGYSRLVNQIPASQV